LQPYDHAVAEKHRFFDVVRDEQKRRALATPDPQDLFLHLNLRERVERGKWLIEQEHTRTRRERSRECGTLSHATRKLVRIRVLESAQTDERDVLGDEAAALRCGQSPNAKRDVFFDREPRHQAVLLEEQSAIEPRPLPSHGCAVYLHGSFVLALEARRDPEQRALTAAARAYDRDDLARCDREIYR
jgi:hypothetical protein